MNFDPIANLITIIMNGYNAGSSRVFIPYSKEKNKILEVLKDEKYIKNVRRLKKDCREMLSVRLLYHDSSPSISMMKRISKPGQRIYAKPSEFRPVLTLAKSRRDMGSTIISTSAGIMTSAKAREKKIGGELILKVY